jgi:hypothetical protein
MTKTKKPPHARVDEADKFHGYYRVVVRTTPLISCNSCIMAEALIPIANQLLAVNTPISDIKAALTVKKKEYFDLSMSLLEEHLEEAGLLNRPKSLVDPVVQSQVNAKANLWNKFENTTTTQTINVVKV